MSKNKAQPEKKKKVEKETRLKIHKTIIAYSIMSQIYLWSFTSIAFGFKQDSLWEFRQRESTTTQYHFQWKLTQFKKSKWEFRMLSESYKLSSPKCSFCWIQAVEESTTFFNDAHAHVHNYWTICLCKSTTGATSHLRRFLYSKYSCTS